MHWQMTASMPPTTPRRTTVRGSALPVVTPRAESERFEPQVAGAMLPKLPRVLDGDVAAPGSGSDTSALNRIAPPESVPPEISTLRPRRSTAAASGTTGSGQRAARVNSLTVDVLPRKRRIGDRSARRRRRGADGHARTVRQPGVDDRPGVRVPAERSGHPSHGRLSPFSVRLLRNLASPVAPWSDAARQRHRRRAVVPPPSNPASPPSSSVAQGRNVRSRVPVVGSPRRPGVAQYRRNLSDAGRFG